MTKASGDWWRGRRGRAPRRRERAATSRCSAICCVLFLWLLLLKEQHCVRGEGGGGGDKKMADVCLRCAATAPCHLVCRDALGCVVLQILRSNTRRCARQERQRGDEARRLSKAAGAQGSTKRSTLVASFHLLLSDSKTSSEAKRLAA